MSYGWKFWLAIAIVVCISFIDTWRQQINDYLSDKGSS